MDIINIIFSRTYKRVYSLLFLLALTACTGGDTDTPANKIGQAIASGLVAMGEVSASTITAYDYSNCKKGDVLATTGAQQSNAFSFDFKFSTEPIPVLFEASDITYTEDFRGLEVSSGDKKLYTAVVLTDGDDRDVAISYWTNLSYARTVNLCKTAPEKVATYIEESNQQFSTALTFDVVADLPLPLSTSTLQLAQINSMRYGIANAAVSKYTYMIDLTNEPSATIHAPYNSIAFADVAFKDLAADGFLNGTGSQGALYFPDSASEPLALEVYRSNIPRIMEDIISVVKDRSTFNIDLIHGVAESFQASGLDIFGNVAGELPSLQDLTAPIINSKTILSCTLAQPLAAIRTIVAEFEIGDPDSKVVISAGIADGCPVVTGDAGCTVADTFDIVNETTDPFFATKSTITMSFDGSLFDSGVIGSGRKGGGRAVDFELTNRSNVTSTERVTFSIDIYGNCSLG